MTNTEIHSDAVRWASIFERMDCGLEKKALKSGLEVAFRVPCPGPNRCVTTNSHPHPGRLVTGVLAVEANGKWLVLGGDTSYFIDTSLHRLVQPQALVPLNLEEQCEALFYEEVGDPPTHVTALQVLRELHEVHGVSKGGAVRFQRCPTCAKYYPHKGETLVREAGHQPFLLHSYCFPAKEGELIARMWNSWQHPCRRMRLTR